MARNLAPACKQCRRAGEKLFLKGEKCFTPKCPVVRRAYPPGMHGQKASSRLSNFGVQLREKQKTKRMYGLLERQFRVYFDRAIGRKGNTGETLLRMLEQRLDNIVYRVGFAKSRAMARQIVRHGHISVNGQRLDIPSYQAQPQDVIAIVATSRDAKVFQDVQKQIGQHQLPTWLTLDVQRLSATVTQPPVVDDLRQSINPQLIVEFYSR